MNDPERINPYQPPRGELQRPEAPEDLFVALSRVADGTPYPAEVHLYVLQGLEFAKQHVQRDATNAGNFDAVDLCWSLHDLAMRRFGESARDRLAAWNVKTTRDFGNVVYQLIEAGFMRADKGDAIEDFDNVFEFANEFKPDESGSTIIED